MGIWRWPLLATQEISAMKLVISIPIAFVILALMGKYAHDCDDTDTDTDPGTGFTAAGGSVDGCVLNIVRDTQA